MKTCNRDVRYTEINTSVYFVTSARRVCSLLEIRVRPPEELERAEGAREKSNSNLQEKTHIANNTFHHIQSNSADFHGDLENHI